MSDKLTAPERIQALLQEHRESVKSGDWKSMDAARRELVACGVTSIPIHFQPIGDSFLFNLTKSDVIQLQRALRNIRSEAVASFWLALNDCCESIQKEKRDKIDRL